MSQVAETRFVARRGRPLHPKTGLVQKASEQRKSLIYSALRL